LARNRSITEDFVDSADDVFDANLRFDEIAICAEGDATLALVFARECGHHDDFDVFCFGRTAQDIEHVKAADFWHHYVTHYQAWTVFDCHRKCLFPIAGGNDIVSFREEADAINLT
jgi:hypothetical protein